MGTIRSLATLLLSSLAATASAQSADLVDFVRGRVVFLSATAQTPTGVPKESFATGFFVNERGNILTAYHLLKSLGPDIDPASIKIEARVRSKNNPPIVTSLYEAKPERDLLLLDIDDEDAGPPLCADTGFNPQRLAVSLFTTGFSSVLPTISQQGKLVSANGPNGTWIVDIPFTPGQSGSPIYDDKAQVIGVAKGQMTDNAGQPVPGLYVVIPVGDASSIVPAWSSPERCKFLPSKPAPEVLDLTQKELRDQVESCVAAWVNGAAKSQPWVVTGGARAEGPGISGDRKMATQRVCYSAPPNFSILGQVDVKDLGNNGGRGSITAVEYLNEQDRVIKACVDVSAWSEEGLFKAGGWQNVQLSGAIERVASANELQGIREECQNRVLSAYDTPVRTKEKNEVTATDCSVAVGGDVNGSNINNSANCSTK